MGGPHLDKEPPLVQPLKEVNNQVGLQENSELHFPLAPPVACLATDQAGLWSKSGIESNSIANVGLVIEPFIIECLLGNINKELN